MNFPDLSTRFPAATESLTTMTPALIFFPSLIANSPIPPDFSTSLTDEMNNESSMGFSISYMVNTPIQAPLRASISTPVFHILLTSTSTSISRDFTDT